MDKKITIKEVKEFLLENSKYEKYKLSKSMNHRYKSWNIFYDKFIGFMNQDDKTEDDYDYIALHLSMYLASWGMYRGSSGLLQYSYKINVGLIEKISDPKYKKLINLNTKKDILENKSLINDLYKDIFNYYNNIDKIENRNISPTNTLVTKIILGTYACMPAYDTFAKETLSSYQILSSLNNMNVEKAIDELVDGIPDGIPTPRPLMKMVDEFLFLKAEEEEMDKRKNK